MEANIADSSLFTQIDPEAIEKHCRRFDLTPEKKLMLAVLTDAIKTVRNPKRRIYGEYIGKNKSKKRRILDEETRRWFDSSEEQWPFSFRHVCYVLGLEPDYVKRGVMRGKRPRRESVGRDEYKKLDSSNFRSKTPQTPSVARCPAIVTRLERSFYLSSISHPVVTRENIK